MRYLVFDTETTGMVRFDRAAHAKGQPRMTQLGLVAVEHLPGVPTEDADGNTVVGADTFTKLFSFSAMVAPDNSWTKYDLAGADEQAASLGNGLTVEQLRMHGVPVAQILQRYIGVFDNCDYLVGFNIHFDLKILRGELRRADLNDLYGEKPEFDVMQKCRPLCNEHFQKTIGKKKAPKLEEACDIILSHKHDGHDALVDADATSNLLWELIKQGRGPEPLEPSLV